MVIFRVLYLSILSQIYCCEPLMNVDHVGIEKYFLEKITLDIFSLGLAHMPLSCDSCFEEECHRET